MPIDPSIALQVKPFTLNDPLDQYGKMLAVKGAQRQFTMEDEVANAARSTNGDPGAMATTLMQRGQFAPAMQLRAQAQHQAQIDVQNKREERKFSNEEIEHNLKLAEWGGQQSVTLDSMWQDALAKHNGDPIPALAEIQPTYTQIRNQAMQVSKGKAQLPEAFDPDLNKANIGNAKNAVEYLKSQQDKYGAPTSAVNPKTGQPELFQPAKTGGEGRWLGVQPAATPGQPPELAKLMAARDALPKGHPDRATYDRVIEEYKAGKGDTNVSVNTGPMTPTKTAATKIDEDLLSATRGLMQLDAIERQYKPEFQQFQDRIGFATLATKEKLGKELTNKEKQDLTEYSSYRRNSVNTMNEYIKSITGSAMSIPEGERITKGMPNPGQGLFDGDSPTEFRAKMYDAMKQGKMAIARLSYMKRNGMSLFDGTGNPVISLDQMPDVINKRGKEIEDELGKTGAKGETLSAAVYRQLATEFGFAHY